MKRIIIALALMAQLPALAQNFTLNGVINDKSYDGLYLYLRRVAVTNSRESTMVDSAMIKDGRFHFELTVTSPYVGHLALPEKDPVHHFLYVLPETDCIVEPDANVTLTYDAADPYAITLTGGRISADYDATVLTANRQCRQQTSQLMKQREADEQKAPYTDAQNDAYSKKITAIYATMKPATATFIKHNIGNDVGATMLFATGPDYLGQATFDSLAHIVKGTQSPGIQPTGRALHRLRFEDFRRAHREAVRLPQARPHPLGRLLGVVVRALSDGDSAYQGTV